MSAFGMGGGGGGSVQRKEAPGGEGRAGARESSAGTPGKGVQLKGDGAAETGDVHATAAAGVAGGGGPLPHLAQIQASFGEHDVSGVQAHTGAAAQQATAALGANAYASGENVAFGDGKADLHTAAHEAAHVVQQRGGVSLDGGVGQAGDQYEQHADAVADQVVAGRDASEMLSQMNKHGSTNGAGGVQAKAIQFDIKADLRKAMSGWGTDEAAIFDRLKRASIQEIDAVVADKKLMDELQDDLSVSEMEKVLDMVNAPLDKKIRVAMSGWFSNDDAYIKKSMDRATPAELQKIGQDAKLVQEMIKTLGKAFLRQCLDRMSVPLATKLEYAMSGWGADEAYVSEQIGKASPGDVAAIANNAKLMAKLDSEGLGHFRGVIARKMSQNGSPADEVFKVLVSDNEATMQQRLDDFGAIKEQRTMLDGVIVGGVDQIRVQRAFAAYWNVEVTSAPAVEATTNGGDNGMPSPAVEARNWPIATLQAIHNELKLIPNQDARAGVWKKLSLTNKGNLINRAAYGGGNFTVGSNAATTDVVPAGYAVTLTAAADKDQPMVEVNEPTRFKKGDTLTLARGTGDAETHKVKDIKDSTYEMDGNLAKRHGRGTVLDPSDGSGAREVNWLNATVRHEIAHALDGGGVDTKGFYAKGNWVLGSGDAGFDTWVTAMGGESAWTPNDGTKISDEDRAKIKAAIVDHTTNQKKSMFSALAATHPVMVNKDKKVGVIDAAEQCLALGDGFYSQPTKLHAANGKRFSISFWYKRFQHHDEAVVTERVADYGLYAPTEFFAEAYTVFYEEAGKPGIKDEELGRLIRNASWRQWIRDNVHNRGLAPAGTGTVKAPGNSPAPTGGETTAPAEEGGARPGGASRGRAAGDPGM